MIPYAFFVSWFSSKLRIQCLLQLEVLGYTYSGLDTEWEEIAV